MSSITCYESENLTIIGAEGEWVGGCSPDQKEWEDVINTIRLHFSMLINGRIKNFYHEFWLEKVNTGILTSDTGEVVAEKMNHWNTYLSLKNFFWWNTLIETMKPLGYMNDIWYSEIQRWIDKLYQQN